MSASRYLRCTSVRHLIIIPIRLRTATREQFDFGLLSEEKVRA